MRTKLKEWDAAIDELEARARQEQAKAGTQFKERIAELQQKRDDARARLREIETAPEEVWESLKEGLESLWDYTKSIFHDSKQAFKEGLHDKR
jgi:chromosome segregation ATPase